MGLFCIRPSDFGSIGFLGLLGLDSAGFFGSFLHWVFVAIGLGVLIILCLLGFGGLVYISLGKCDAHGTPYVELDCKFRDVTYNTVGTLFTCDHKSTTRFEKSGTMIYRMNAENFENKTNDKVFAFNSFNGGFEKFPRNLNEIFPRLKAIRIFKGFLTEISQQELRKFPELEHLDLDENKIQVIEVDLFKFNTRIKIIWLGNNTLKSFEVESMKKLNHLKQIDARPNCTSKYPIALPSDFDTIASNCAYTDEQAINAMSLRNKDDFGEIECRVKAEKEFITKYFDAQFANDKLIADNTEKCNQTPSNENNFVQKLFFYGVVPALCVMILGNIVLCVFCCSKIKDKKVEGKPVQARPAVELPSTKRYQPPSYQANRFIESDNYDYIN